MKRTCLLFVLVLIALPACSEDTTDDTDTGTSDGSSTETDATGTQTEPTGDTGTAPHSGDTSDTGTAPHSGDTSDTGTAPHSGDTGDTGQATDQGDSGTGDPACGKIPWIGCCVGNVIHYCENPASPHVVTQDCAGYRCGYSAKVKLFKCNSQDTPPEGYPLECPPGSY